MWDVKPGDLVVFVEEGQQCDIRTGKPCDHPLNRGAIYTVSDVLAFDEIFVRLEERPPSWGWRLRYFRPVAKPSIEPIRSVVRATDLELV
jgi:hypothetical protein